MAAPEPLPSSVPWVVGGTAAVAALLALVFAVGLPSLRQGRLLDEATAISVERSQAAASWLDREESVAALLATERADGVVRDEALLDADGAASLQGALKLLAEQHVMTLDALRLGTRRTGEAFDTVPTTAVFVGNRTSLPELLDNFYRQPRVVRLVSLDLELPKYGSVTVQATLRWEYASLPEEAPEADDPTRRWSPPSLVADAGPARITALNRGRWDELETAAAELRALAPRLRRLAAMDAERAQLERQRIAIKRWREASAAEAQAVQRRLPELLRRMDLSALGEAALRPGPGGLVVAEGP
ncbi:MAG: hypothetical protein KDA24_24925 [Deltaproteobacteria bacterium]|nr:hypothetical protein [Deltaproteobacteria bacterium]